MNAPSSAYLIFKDCAVKDFTDQDLNISLLSLIMPVEDARAWLESGASVLTAVRWRLKGWRLPSACHPNQPTPRHAGGMLVTDALAVLRQAALDGRITRGFCLDLTKELEGFAHQLPEDV